MRILDYGTQNFHRAVWFLGSYEIKFPTSQELISWGKNEPCFPRDTASTDSGFASVTTLLEKPNSCVVDGADK